MDENNAIRINRKLLYDEIWEMSALGVSKKYDMTYSRLLKLCKDNDIPIPPAGYFTSISFGKHVDKAPLPESAIVDVVLDTSIKKKIIRNKVASQTKAIAKSPSEKAVVTPPVKKMIQKPPVELAKKDDTKSKPEAQVEYKLVSGVYNVYKRETLYEEVWSKPVVDIASAYGVSDVTILKVCNTLFIPLPPRGYWAMKNAGEKVEKTPLPETEGPTQKSGPRSYVGVKGVPEKKEVLAFLDDNERNQVLDASAKLTVEPESGLIHKKIDAYKTVVNEWNNKDSKGEFAQRSYTTYSQRPPFLAGIISTDTLPRVYRLLDTLFREVERLGGSVNDDLSLQIRNEQVRLEIVESQVEKRHEITKQEAQALIKFEDANRHHTWAPEPKIRKNDYIFNGKIRIGALEGKYFRDADNIHVEDRLGEILIDLYEESEVVRLEREAWEDRKRKSEEEAKTKEARRNRYNEEVERTIALQNEALDYQIAGNIRTYIAAVKKKCGQAELDNETVEWIEWAINKANWFDPTVARNDEFFGVRQHGKNADKKALERAGYYW